jgi:hypothetical protein
MTSGPDRNGMEDDRRTEDVDALELLRAADPVDRAGLPDADSPGARALFQEIVMATPTPDTTPTASPRPTAPPPTSTPRRRPAFLAVAAAAVAVFATAIGFAVLGGSGDTADEPAPIATGDEQVDPMPGGGMALCAEIYDLESLRNRTVAFDGTLTAVEGDNVTFTVNEVFRGDLGDTITLGGGEIVAADGALTSVPGAGLTVGDRALVAGDAEYAWGCGFTQPYDPAVADEWRSALG